jgi:hypothetical protein
MVDASGQNSLADFSPDTALAYTAEDKAEPDGLPMRGKQALNRLIKMIHDYGKDRQRVRSLVTFEARQNAAGSVRERSIVEYNDRPEIELYIHHRNETLRLDADIEFTRKKLQDIVLEPADFLTITTNLATLQTRKAKEIEAMERILATLAKEQSAKETLMAKIATDAAKLVQAASQHQDKMRLADKMANIPSSSDLKATLALKYGVPVDQVDAILSAKSVDVTAEDRRG